LGDTLYIARHDGFIHRIDISQSIPSQKSTIVIFGILTILALSSCLCVAIVYVLIRIGTIKVPKVPRIRFVNPFPVSMIRRRGLEALVIAEDDPILSYGSGTSSVKSAKSDSSGSSFPFLSKSLFIKIEDLEFIKRLSEGSYGIVFLGRYRGSHVAIKVNFSQILLNF
jgi:hypothetical protein